MPRNQRLAFAALAAIIAVAAIVLLSGGSDEEPASDRAAAPAQTATPESTPVPEEAEPRSTPEPTATPEPAPELVEYRAGKAVGGVKRLEFKKGETARFAIASDVDEEIHVHGYDVYKDVKSGGRARFEFKADIEGIFEVEMHGSAVQVAQLRVEP